MFTSTYGDDRRATLVSDDMKSALKTGNAIDYSVNPGPYGLGIYFELNSHRFVTLKCGLSVTCAFFVATEAGN
ncbi:MAG: hypothetical protein WAO83_10550 [Fuerstiella sp.]